MQEESIKFDRRTFLRLSGTGAALAGVNMLLPSIMQAEEYNSASSRKAPEKSVTLHSSELQVVLDSTDGLPYEFHLGNSRLRGEDFGKPISVRLYRQNPRGFADVSVAAAKISHTSTQADFLFHAVFEGTTAAAFTLRYELQGTTLLLTLEDIKEMPGFELISVDMPCLVTVRNEDGKAWLVHGDAGGSLTMLGEAKPATLPPNQFWGNILGTLPVVMVGTDHAMCVQETTAYMDGTFLTVAGTGASRRAFLGTSKVHRVDGSSCYELNAGKDVPRNCGNTKTPNLLVEQQSSCRLDFLPVNGAVEDAWLQGAKLVRSRMPEIPNHFYDDKYIYGIRCDEPTFPKPASTFAECETKIRETAALLDNWPQVVHLWGWQFRGKDTGYPAVNEVNERIGGYEGMMRVMERGKEVNATVTISDNYDDAYRSSPAWSDSIIARRPDGELWKSRNWTGEDSYIVGLAKYMEGPGVERVRYTCERYKLPQTTHVDVLSYFAIRNDWDPAHPASGIRNLTEGRYRVLKEFKTRGVDVSSEALRYPMIGHISCYWYAQGPGHCPFGGKTIPLLPLIYRKSAVWGLSGGHNPDPVMTRLNELFLGASPRAVGLSQVDYRGVQDLFYLWLLPWFEFHLLNIESFRREGERTILGLEHNSSIEIDWSQKTHRIVLNGNEIAKTGQVTCPMGRDRYAFYSSEPQTLHLPLPADWDSSAIGAVTILPDRREAVPFKLVGREVEIEAPAQQPVILYKNKFDRKLS